MAEPAALRIQGLDALRGAAVCGMLVYHLAWDLHALGWTSSSPAESPAWTAFGDVVAGTFLTLSGVGLALARPKGWRVALRRVAVLATAALAVTEASLRFAPEAPILFGALHCIAAADAVALMVLDLPGAARLGLAAFTLALPRLVRSRGFDGWPGAALGLAIDIPPTLDYRPLLPWLCAVLLGTVAGDLMKRHRFGANQSGRVMQRRGGPERFLPRRPGNPVGGPRAARSLRWMGRHSLALYLAHQPALYGLLMLVGAVAGRPEGGADPFDRQCRSDCVTTGAAERLCAAACSCTRESLATEARSGAMTLAPGHVDEVASACHRSGG